MTTIAAPLTATLYTIAAFLRRRLAGIASWHQGQRDYRTLCEMDDWTLRDMGILPSDLRDATAVSRFGDPTLLIALRIAERDGRTRAEDPRTR